MFKTIIEHKINLIYFKFMNIVTFGEIMMRFSTNNNNRLIQSKSLELSFAGSEANVAIDLAYWGMKTRFITALPENDLGDMVIRDLKQNNVDTNFILRNESNRLGLFFLEHGANQRNSKIIYDRKDSSFSIQKFDEQFFSSALKDCNWFHWSGITSGLNMNSINNLETGLKIANENNLTISCDLNYRAKLWDFGIDPNAIMPKILTSSRIIIGNEEDAFKMLNVQEIEKKYFNKEPTINLYKEACIAIFEVLPNCEIICFSLRKSISANHNNWSAILATRNDFFESTTYEIKNIVDRVGAGDTFSAGIIYGLNNFPNDLKKTLEFATAASCLKHSINGDYCIAKQHEIEQLLNGNNSGRIIR